MQKTRRASEGFGLVGIAFVATVLLVAAFLVWRVYGNTSNHTSTPSAEQSTSTATTKSPESKRYLEIKEFGIKLTLSNEIKDAVYYYDATNTYPLVRVSTQTLIDKSGGTCDPKVSSPFGTIRRTLDPTQPDGSVLKPNGSTVFQFEGSYYVFTTPNQACSSNAVIANLETMQLASFKEAVKTMQSAK